MGSHFLVPETIFFLFSFLLLLVRFCLGKNKGRSYTLELWPGCWLELASPKLPLDRNFLIKAEHGAEVP